MAFAGTALPAPSHVGHPRAATRLNPNKSEAVGIGKPSCVCVRVGTRSEEFNGVKRLRQKGITSCLLYEFVMSWHVDVEMI